MKVFISWSGELSKQVAQLFGNWVEDVLQGTKAWISTDDIDKGSIWFGDISSQLSETSAGVLCLTRENLNAPWLLFEAGCLSKGLSKSRVCPLLINLNHSDLTPPLSQFNGTLPKRDDILKLLKTINTQSAEKALSDEKLEKALDRWWTEFETPFQEIIRNYKPGKFTQRPMQEMVAETLELARAIQRRLQADDDKVAINEKLRNILLGRPNREALLSQYLSGDVKNYSDLLALFNKTWHETSGKGAGPEKEDRPKEDNEPKENS